MNGVVRLSNTDVGANLGTSWHVKGAEDFNGDGKSDIVCRTTMARLLSG